MSKEKRFRSFSGIQIQDSSFDVIRLKGLISPHQPMRNVFSRCRGIVNLSLDKSTLFEQEQMLIVV